MSILARYRGVLNNIPKTAYVVGTKLLLETETYSSFNGMSSNANFNTANRGISAYGLGGDYGGPSRRVYFFDFRGESESFLGESVLNTPRAYAAMGGSNFGVAGYVAGGLTTGYARTGAAEKINYSTNVCSNLSSISSRGYLTTFSNSGSAAYDAGGFATSYLTTVQKRNFSNDSLSTVTSMATGRQYPHSISNHGTAGYVAGGQNTSSTRTASIEKYSYSNDSRSTLSATLSEATYAATGAAYIGVRGYSLGGSNAANNASTSRINRINFSNDTRSTLTSLLSAFWYGGVYENG